MELEFSERMRKANKIDNPISLLPEFEKYSNKDVNVKLETKRSGNLDEKTKNWCFSLFERNMRQIYEASKRGWNEAEKKEEMFHEKAYYVIAYDSNTNEALGYSHFRFDIDYENEVIYCYELQIEPSCRKCGLGKFILEFLEALCEKLELEKVILTCSKHNKIGQRFFKEKMKYERDETDPNDEDPTVDYDILSKVFWEVDD